LLILNWTKDGANSTTCFENTVFRLHIVNKKKRFTFYGPSENFIKFKSYFKTRQFEGKTDQAVFFLLFKKENVIFLRILTI